MDELTREINSILKHIDKERWIAFSKNDTPIRFKAKDKLRAYGLIERHGQLSWQFTREGYKAVELGGFHIWIKTQKQNNNLRKVGIFLGKFWWYFIIPIIAGIIIWELTVKKDANMQGKQILNDNNPNYEQNKKKEPYIDQVSSSTGNVDSNKVFLQSFKPVELFKGDLIITLNNSVEAINQEIELKLVQKNSLKTETVKNKKIGDVIRFDKYLITLLSLERNIQTYDLVIKFETTK